MMGGLRAFQDDRFNIEIMTVNHRVHVGLCKLTHRFFLSDEMQQVHLALASMLTAPLSIRL